MIPHATQRLEEWRAARRHAGRMLVALDFDGTLAPIAQHPAAVELPPAARAALERLARRPDTDVAIVSGRALEDVRRRVDLPDLYYAGNHGIEIEGPGIQEVHRDAARAMPRIAACAEALRRALADDPGYVLEDKGLTLSVHYRLSRDPHARERILSHVCALCDPTPGLRITEGKKVVEVRPDVPWDKGRATRFLLDALQAGLDTRIPALFIGDDRTDEDAFVALRDCGAGIVVADEPPAETAATAFLRSPREVADFLADLAEPA